jgi:hypothetical protein
MPLKRQHSFVMKRFSLEKLTVMTKGGKIDDSITIKGRRASV